MSAAYTVLSVRVYRSAVAGASLYMGRGYKDTKNTNGYVRFVPAGTPMRHPQNHEDFAYPYGEFCTSDQELIEAMDDMIRSGNTVMFAAAVDPLPLESVDLTTI